MSYNKTVWHTGDVVHADQLNNIEEGINRVDNKLEGIEEGAQVNKVEGIQFNGSDLTPDTETKKVNISAAPYNQAVPLPQQNDEGKILGYEAPTEGARPIVGWVEKPSNGVTPHIDQTTKHWMIGEEDTEVDAEGKDAYQIAVSQGYEGTKSQWLDYLKGDKGDNAISPFKGWVNATSALPANPHVGDYAYVEDSGTTYVYRCTTEGTWPTTSSEEKEPSSATFATAQLLNNTKIDDTHLANPIGSDEDNNPTLAKAEDVLQLKAKLEGVTAEDTKVQLVTSGEGQNVYEGYINGSTGAYVQSDHNRFIVVPLNGAKSVRWLGKENADNSSLIGWAFGTFSGEIDATLSTFTALSKGVYANNPLDNQAVEYVKDAPEGATHAVITIRIYKSDGGSAVTMDNFYCYLQSGESVSDMIDELDKKVNGEDYDVIGDDIRPASCNSQWRICTPSATGTDNAIIWDTKDRTFSISLTNYRGKKLLVKSNASYYSYYMVLKKAISITDAPYTVQQLIDGDYLCEEIHYLNGEWKPSLSIVANTTVEIPIPNDAVRILFTGLTIGDSIDRNVQSVQVISTEHADGTIDNVKEELQQQIDSNKEDIEELQGVSEQVDEIVDELYGVPTEVTETPLMNIRKGSLDPTKFYSNPFVQTIYELDVSDATKVNISAQASLFFILFVSKAKLPTSGNFSASYMRSNYMAVCDGFAPESNQYRINVASGGSVELTLNENCKYLYISKYYSSADRTPSSITTTKTKRTGGIIEQISGEESNQGNALRLVIKDGKCFTAPIPCEKGFHLLVKDDYRITNAYLVDHLTGNIVNDDFSKYSNTTISSVQNKEYRRCSNMCKMPGFDIIYQIEKLDNSLIESSSAVIEEFSLVEDLYTRKLPTGVEPSIYRAWRDKVQTSIGNVWIPSLKAANKIPQSHENNNPKRFGKGTTYIGVNYSGPTQWGKHVGMQVSMRTFKTAVANPRSVMYTEIIGSYAGKTAQSKYGYNHNSYGREAGAFYGCVCTGLTSYLMGFPMVFQSAEWNSGSVSAKMNVVMKGTTSNPDVISCNGNEYLYDSKNDCKALAELLQPMDFIWKDGHCATISDIYVDEWGEVKYIVISEQVTPTSTSQAYTPEYFFLRFKNNIVSGDDWKILRRKDNYPWTIEDASIPRVDQDKKFVVMNNSQYNPENMGDIDSDITTFAGEYAVFVIGDYSDTTNNFKMFLNIHRGGAEGYTHIQIFNEDDNESTATPVDEIDITSYQTESSLGTNGYILPSDEDEDWIIYNLAEYWRTSQTNNTGKFKARVVRKESGSIVEGYISGCTHFMMVAMSLNLNNSTINYTVKGAIPVVYECEIETGLFTGYSRYKNLVLDTDYTYNSETGEYTSVGTPLGSWTGAYLVLFAKTDYGMANVKVALSNS